MTISHLVEEKNQVKVKNTSEGNGDTIVNKIKLYLIGTSRDIIMGEQI